MNIESLRTYCLSFPKATENIQWGHDLCFKVMGKMFVGKQPWRSRPGQDCVSSCTPDSFAELIERAAWLRPHMWPVSMGRPGVARHTRGPRIERALIAKSYELWQRSFRKRRGRRSVSADRPLSEGFRGKPPESGGID